MKASILLLLVACAAAQDLPRNRLTFSGGWSHEMGGYDFQHRTATGFGASYGRRLLHYVEAETGVFTAIHPSSEVRGANYDVQPDDNFLWVPFGVRFIAPLYLDRIEFSAGGGGLYEHYSVGNLSRFSAESYSGWGGYFVGSASVSLDRGKHFWLGATPRWFLGNPPFFRNRWFQMSGEFSVRFR